MWIGMKDMKVNIIENVGTENFSVVFLQKMEKVIFIYNQTKEKISHSARKNFKYNQTKETSFQYKMC